MRGWRIGIKNQIISVRERQIWLFGTNAILIAAGLNMRKLLSHIFYAFFEMLQKIEINCKISHKLMSC